MQYQTDDQKVITAMSKYGGSFVKQLARLFVIADHLNYIKLKKTFAVYWKDYERMAKIKNPKKTVKPIKYNENI